MEGVAGMTMTRTRSLIFRPFRMLAAMAMSSILPLVQEPMNT